MIKEIRVTVSFKDGVIREFMVLEENVGSFLQTMMSQIDGKVTKIEISRF